MTKETNTEITETRNTDHALPPTGTDARPWGATPAEWAHWVARGLQEDLLPVVSNPHAEIHPSSKMRDLGKTPSRYHQTDRRVVGIPAWTRHTTTDREVGRWSKDNELGICIQTRTIRALDIDISDPAQAERAAALIELTAGELPTRGRGNSGKRLLIFRMPGEYPKRILKTPHGAIEFLATGQQFVACGTHPSGERYEWAGGLPADIPELHSSEFEALWQSLADALAPRSAGASDNPNDIRTRNGLAPQVPRRRDDINDPVVAYLDANLMIREWSRDGRVHVTCPWEEEHTGDTGASASSWFPAGVGGFAQGHYKCLHAHCAHRTDAHYLDAIGYSAAQFDVVAPTVDAQGVEAQPWPTFPRNRDGTIATNATSVNLALSRPDFCGYRLAYDAFKALVVISPAEGTDAGRWRALKDTDYFALRVSLERRGFKGVGSEVVREAMLHVAEQNTFDSAQQWLDGLKHDGVSRIGAFFPKYFGTADTPYTRAVSLYAWTALAGRVLHPGVKADMVPVLVGGQGVGKTMGVRAMSPSLETFVEINLEHRDDNLARSLRGKLVGELGELRGLLTREAESIKAWITRTHEEWVPKFKEFATEFPRRLLMVGTTNEQSILADPTGERRWLPMFVGESGALDVAGIERDCEQLWAEGRDMFAEQGGVQWKGAQGLATAEHHQFKDIDEWQDAIREWLAGGDFAVVEGGAAGGNLAGVPRETKTFTTAEIAAGALGFNVRDVSKREANRIGKAMRELGWELAVVRDCYSTSKKWRLTLKAKWANVQNFAELG